MSEVEAMTNAQRYRAFRNFMFNELGVSKEDIRQWIIEAVQEQVRKTQTEQRVEAMIERELTAQVKTAVRSALGVTTYNRTPAAVERAISAEIQGRIQVTLKDPE